MHERGHRAKQLQAYVVIEWVTERARVRHSLSNSRLTWLVLATIGLIASLSAFIASGVAGRAINAALGRHIRGEITSAETATALLVQSVVLITFLLGAMWAASWFIALHSKWTAAWVSNPVSVAFAYILYTMIRLEPPRGYYPSWVPELTRRCVWYSATAVVASVLFISIWGHLFVGPDRER